MLLLVAVFVFYMSRARYVGFGFVENSILVAQLVHVEGTQLLNVKDDTGSLPCVVIDAEISLLNQLSLAATLVFRRYHFTRRVRFVESYCFPNGN